jgi:hypothetical protein
MGPKGFSVVMLVAVTLFAFLMLWIATSSGKVREFSPTNGAEALEIVETYEEGTS